MVFLALTAIFCPFVQKSINAAAGRVQLHYNALKQFFVSAMPSVNVDRLQPGIFISLSHIGWIRHPFLLNEFRLSSEKQIRALQEMGLKEVEWHPERSTALPLPVPTSHEAEEGEMDFGASALAGMLDEKKQRIDRVRRQRDNLARREREYNEELAAVSDILKSVAADPPEAHTHAQALAGHVVAGLMGADQVREAIVGSRALVLPSFAEGLPVVVMEALALGRPVVTTAIAGIPELVQSGVTGWLVPAGSVDALATAMREALEAPPAQLAEMGRVGSALVAKEHDAAREATKLAGLFRSALLGCGS